MVGGRSIKDSRALHVCRQSFPQFLTQKPGVDSSPPVEPPQYRFGALVVDGVCVDVAQVEGIVVVEIVLTFVLTVIIVGVPKAEDEVWGVGVAIPVKVKIDVEDAVAVAVAVAGAVVDAVAVADIVAVADAVADAVAVTAAVANAVTDTVATAVAVTNEVAVTFADAESTTDVDCWSETDEVIVIEAAVVTVLKPDIVGANDADVIDERVAAPEIVDSAVLLEMADVDAIASRVAVVKAESVADEVAVAVADADAVAVAVVEDDDVDFTDMVANIEGGTDTDN